MPESFLPKRIVMVGGGFAGLWAAAAAARQRALKGGQGSELGLTAVYGLR